MDKKYVYKNKKALVKVAILTVIFIAAYVAILMTNAGFFPHIQARTSVPGIMTAIQLVCAVNMVLTDNKTGSKVALIAMGASVVFAVISSIARKSFDAVPGIMFMIAGVLVLLIISTAMKRLHDLSYTDALTGIANRRQVNDYIDYLVASKLPFDVYYIDLDHYKYINDSYGHDKGDEILKRIVRQWDSMNLPGLMARFGGDEFLYIAPAISDEEKWARSKAIIASVGECCLKYLAGADVDITASIGVASYPEHSIDGDEIIKMADKAMYQAKKAGRNGWRKYGDNTDGLMLREHDVEVMLKDALENDGFRMLYAPLCGEGRQVKAFSARMRLVAPNQEVILPPEFLPIATKSDLIVRLDEYEINRCIKDMSPLVKAYDVMLSMRVSAKQLITPGFVGAIESKLTSYDFPPHKLELEVNEQALSDSSDRVLRTIRELKVKGIQISIDGGVLRELGCDSHRYLSVEKLVDIEGAKALLER